MKILHIDPGKCTGCRNCAIACSLNKFGSCNPHRAAVRVIRDEFERYEIPVVCVQCEDPICLKSCPQNAYRIENKVIVHDEDKCILCGLCSVLCPYQGINFTGEELIKCDLCGGDPACVKYCSTNAIEFVEAESVSTEARKENVERIVKSKGVKQKST